MNGFTGACFQGNREEISGTVAARREELLCMEKITGHFDVGSFRHNQSTSSLETEKFVLLWSTFIFN
ncbi:hypothetical protein AB3S75_008380 [Citrus x aurantiifolia]